MYVSDIIKNLPRTVTASQFVDDIGLFSNYKNTPEKAVHSVNSQLSILGLELAPHKTTFINFNKKNIQPGETEFKFRDSLTIHSSESARFLGIVLDYKLSFIPHINLLLNKCYRTLNIIKYLQGISWGSDPLTLLTFYKNFVRAIIDYGCVVYFPTRKNLINKIEQVQYKAIRAALGYRTTTPINILLHGKKHSWL